MSEGPRVAVTGLGFVSSIGNDQKSVTDSLQAGRSGIGIHPELQAANAPVLLAGLIKGFDFPSEYPQSWSWPETVEISRSDLRSLAPHGVYARVALQEALSQAQISDQILHNEDTGLLTASAGSTRLLHHHLEKMHARGVSQCHPFVLTCSIAGTLSFNLAASLGIRGVSGGCVSACASSAQAIGMAFDQIKMRRQKRMIIAGAEDCDLSTILPFAAFHALTRATDPSESPCVFDQRRDGFAATGGATVMILEELTGATDRGVTPLAELTAWGWTSDGFHPMSPEPGGEGIERAMRMALREAGLAPADIDYVNAHATATQAGDKAEALALRRVFGSAGPWISSTKGQTGHALSASGILEAGISVLAMRHGIVPANLHLRDPEPAAESLRLPRAPQRTVLRRVLSNSSGFGGVNVSLLFQSIAS